MFGLLDRRLLTLALVPALGCIVGGDNAESGGASDPTATASATDDGTTAVSSTSGTTSGMGTVGSGTDSVSTDATNAETSSTTNESSTADACPQPIDGSDFCCKTQAEGFAEVPTFVQVTLALTVNGAPLNQGESDDGDLYLVSASGDRILVGHTTFDTLTVKVYPGVYSVVYESESHGLLLPWNTRVTIVPEMLISTETTIEHDIPVVHAVGQVKVNGGAPPSSQIDDADIFVVDEVSGARTLIARTSLLGAGGTFDANLVPGSYQVRYLAHLRKDVMPYNTDSRLADLEILDVGDKGAPPPDSPTAPIEIQTEIITGGIKVNGADAIASPLDHGRIYLRDRESDTVTLIADTAQGGFFDIPVLAAPDLTYDVIYALAAHKDLMPMNEWAVVHEDMDAAAVVAELKSLDLQTVLVGGTFSIDGAPPVNNAYNSGEVILGGAADRAVVGGGAGNLAGVILAGSYDVFFRHTASDGQLPLNTRGRVQTDPVALFADDVLDLAIASSVIEGEFQISGTAPPVSAYDSGRIFLRNSDGDVVHLGYTSDGGFSRRVINGTYEVYYSVQATKGGAPANHDAWVTDLVINGDATPLINVLSESVKFSNPIFNDEPGTGSGRLYLRDLANGDEIYVGTTATAMLEARLMPSDYALVYRVDILGEQVASNNGVAFGCLRVEGH